MIVLTYIHFALLYAKYVLNFGLLPDMLLELARREKNAGIKPDEDLDLFMKVPFHFLLLSFLTESISLVHFSFFSKFDKLHPLIQINLV